MKGLTKIEVDYIHRGIERNIKNRNINHPQNYVETIRKCRIDTPFKVEYSNFEFFKDFTSIRYLDSIRPGKKKNDSQVYDL